MPPSHRNFHFFITSVLVLLVTSAAALSVSTPVKLTCKYASVSHPTAEPLKPPTLTRPLAVTSHPPASVPLPSARPLSGGDAAGPYCTRVLLRGRPSRLRDPSRFFHALRLRANATRPHGLELCFHRNATVGPCQCAASQWQKMPKSGLWMQAISPYDHRILDFRMPTDPSRSVVVSTEEEFLLHRVVFLVLGLVLMVVAQTLSESVVFYYGGAMTIGIFLVILIILFQGMKLLPTGRKSSLAIFTYSSLVGMTTYFLHYLSGMLRSVLVEIGIAEDMHNPVFIGDPASGAGQAQENSGIEIHCDDEEEGSENAEHNNNLESPKEVDASAESREANGKSENLKDVTNLDKLQEKTGSSSSTEAIKALEGLMETNRDFEELKDLNGSSEELEEENNGNMEKLVELFLDKGLLDELKPIKVESQRRVRATLSIIDKMMISRVVKGGNGANDIHGNDGAQLTSIEEEGRTAEVSDDGDPAEVESCVAEKVELGHETTHDSTCTALDGGNDGSYFPWREELESLVRGGVPMALRGEIWQAFVGVGARRIPRYYNKLLDDRTETLDEKDLVDPVVNEQGSAPRKVTQPEKWKGQTEKLGIFVLVSVILAGAWFGYWGVRKFVLAEDGSVDEGVAYFVEWAILIVSAVMILQSSLDYLFAFTTLVLCGIIKVIARIEGKSKVLRYIFG
ncbi:hypothetical protein ZEAMMB73_Zm00001d048570 [Zea mays]|uniref:Ypt/Rab-GAP domain of gyp1p superfamily protein n=1 Tax=Zea mays TaxID=4577 RepID=A0A1D6PMT2_MAIZE|nr:hypothetical protein ZEAMMB73_Zm00001d048570 [Zea mays]